MRISSFLFEFVRNKFIITETSRMLATPLLEFAEIFALPPLADARVCAVFGVDGDEAGRVVGGANEILPYVVEAVD